MSQKDIQLDLSDPNNPIGKVREAHVNFIAVYKGEDAWNQNILVNKLEIDLKKLGWDVRTFHLEMAYDAEGKPITENDMREYIFRKHGHSPGSRCPSCPDPVKWKEVERLRLKAFAEDQERWKEGRPNGFNWATGEFAEKVVYVYETEEERKNRMREESLLSMPSKEQKAIVKAKKEDWEYKIQHGNETKTKKYEPDPDYEPTLQYNPNKSETTS